MTKYAGVIGYPVKNTASNGIMNNLYKNLKMDFGFKDWEIADTKDLPAFVDYLRTDDVIGTMITMPYKQSIIPLIDRLDEQAIQMKAINTIYKKDGQLVGTNTDSLGFLQALTSESGFEPAGKKITVLGAGGAARGCSVILAEKGAGKISFINRTVARAKELAAEIGTATAETVAMNFEDSRLGDTVRQSDLIVNCTSFGMKGSVMEGQAPPLPDGIFHEGQLLYDNVYKPLETPLMKTARVGGASVFGGITMVIYVCAGCFRLWHNQEAPIDQLFEGAKLAAERFHWK